MKWNGKVGVDREWSQSIIQKETEKGSLFPGGGHGVQGGWGWAERKTTLKVKEKTTVIMCLLFGIWGSGRDKERLEDEGVTVIRPGTWKPRLLAFLLHVSGASSVTLERPGIKSQNVG